MAIQPITQKVPFLMACYVITSDGEYLVQRQANNMWGFELCSEDQSWPGGYGLPSSSWEDVKEGDVPPEVKDRLGYLFDEDVEDDWLRFHPDYRDIDLDTVAEGIFDDDYYETVEVADLGEDD